MLLWIAIVLLQIGSTRAAVAAGPGPCENGTIYDSNAASCPNTNPDIFCQTLFPGTVKNNGPSGGTTRDAKCLTEDPSLTHECARQCGLCCKLPEYDCENPKVRPYDCDVITQDQCNNATLRASIAKWCPNVCGFCIDNGCIDIAPDCATQVPHICFDIELHEFAAENCRKSCDQCNSPLPTTTGKTTRKPVNSPPAATTRKAPLAPSVSACVDKDKKCRTYTNYCTNPFYLNNPDDATAPKKMCAKTCGFCS